MNQICVYDFQQRTRDQHKATKWESYSTMAWFEPGLECSDFDVLNDMAQSECIYLVWTFWFWEFKCFREMNMPFIFFLD